MTKNRLAFIQALKQCRDENLIEPAEMEEIIKNLGELVSALSDAYFWMLDIQLAFDANAKNKAQEKIEEIMARRT